MHEPGAIFVFALALGAGVLAQALARHLRLPSIVPLLATGVALGPDGIGWIVPDQLGEGLVSLVLLAVAVILFEGGLNLDLRRLRREARAIRMLVTAGALVTAIGGTLAARWVMGWGWSQAVLFGTLVIVTGPTVVRPILRNVALSRRLATVVEAEGVLIDPIGAIIAAVALQIVVGASEPDTLSSGFAGLGLRLAFGTVAGLGFGAVLGWLLRSRSLIPEGLENVFTLGLVLLLFALCELQVPESGILAVTVAGVVVGNAGTKVAGELREFQDHLTLALIALLFVLLAADVRVADVVALGWPGVVTVGLLVFLVRPVNVLVSTVDSGLSGREKAFLSWIAPRGIVAAAVASLFAAALEAEGIGGGVELRALVFLTIAGTVLIQGASAPLVARALGVSAPGREGIAILGAEDFAFALGDFLRAEGQSVTFLDANPSHCRAAQEREYPVVFGNALKESVMVRARLHQMSAAVGLSPNDEVNGLFAREARDEFAVPEVYAALSRLRSGVTPEVLERQGSRLLFDGPKDVERWNVRFRHGIAHLERFRFTPPPEVEGNGKAGGSDGSARSDPYVILCWRRSSRWQLMHAGLALREGDTLMVALHDPEAEMARERLARQGLLPAPKETEAQAEA